jgi:putative tryptophan/tyrosine transport system substrate-binding protein
VIIAVTHAVAQAVRPVTGTTPIVWIGGDPMLVALATSLARPAGNVTGVTVFAGAEIFGKRRQFLKEAVPAASEVAWLTTRTSAGNDEQLHEAGRRLGISVIDMALQGSITSEVERLFADVARKRLDAIMVNSHGDLLAHRQLIVALAEKTRRPAIYPWREYVEAGGLMAYATDLVQLSRRVATDVHQIFDGAKAGDIPIYEPTKYEFLIDLKAANDFGLTIPPAPLAQADEVIE